MIHISGGTCIWPGRRYYAFLFVSVLFAVFLERQIKRYIPFLKAPFRANGLCMNTSVAVLVLVAQNWLEVHVFTFDGIHSLLKDILTVGPGICFNSSSSALRDFYFICRICSSGF